MLFLYRCWWHIIKWSIKMLPCKILNLWEYLLGELGKMRWMVSQKMAAFPTNFSHMQMLNDRWRSSWKFKTVLWVYVCRCSNKRCQKYFEKVSSTTEVHSNRNSSIKHKIILVISQSFWRFLSVLRFQYSKFLPLSPSVLSQKNNYYFLNWI